MTIENIVARYTYNFMAFDDYLAIVFKNELDEDNFYHDLIDYGEGVEWVKRWKSDGCVLDVVKRMKKSIKELFEIACEFAEYYSFSIEFGLNTYTLWLSTPSVPYKMFEKEFNNSNSEVNKYFDISEDHGQYVLTLKKEYRDDE